jgi:hypothetical protein
MDVWQREIGCGRSQCMSPILGPFEIRLLRKQKTDKRHPGRNESNLTGLVEPGRHAAARRVALCPQRSFACSRPALGFR